MNILLAAVALTAALKVGDIAVGRFLGFSFQTGPIRHLVLREPAPNYARLARPDEATLAQAEGLSSDLVPYRADPDGFIEGPDRESGPVDMVFVGGSTTECAYVPEDLRFPYRVSRLLVRQTGQPVRTLNAGYSGNNTMHALLLILGKVLPYNPKFVVFMEAVNDLAVLEKTGSYWTAPESRALVRFQRDKPWAISVKDWLVPNSWQLAKAYVGQWLPLSAPDEFAGYRPGQPTVSSFGEATAQFHAALVTLVQTVRAWGSQPVLMTQFNRMDPGDAFIESHSGRSPADYAQLVSRYKAFNEVIRLVAREQHVVLIDLDREIPHSSRYIVDPVHLNTEGSRLVAAVVARHFAAAFPEFAPSPRP